MSDPVDWRLLEIQLEDLYGRLQALKQSRNGCSLQLARNLREVSEEILSVSKQLRRSPLMKPGAANNNRDEDVRQAWRRPKLKS